MEPNSPEANFKILVVDDSECIREGLTILLIRRGYRCESATNGIEAAEKVRQSDFDAVVADLQMPEMDGIGLTRELHQHFSDLPVMIMTGQPDESLSESATRAGAREVLEKPFEISDFMARLHRMLHDREPVLEERT